MCWRKICLTILFVFFCCFFILDLVNTLEYFRHLFKLICTVIGGLVNSYTWKRDGVIISDSDPLFNPTLTITDRSTVTSQLVLSGANISSFVGTYQCIITDGGGRMSTATHIINGNNNYRCCSFMCLSQVT